jgi:hypothetical protein
MVTYLPLATPGAVSPREPGRPGVTPRTPRSAVIRYMYAAQSVPAASPPQPGRAPQPVLRDRLARPADDEPARHRGPDQRRRASSAAAPSVGCSHKNVWPGGTSFIWGAGRQDFRDPCAGSGSREAPSSSREAPSSSREAPSGSRETNPGIWSPRQVSDRLNPLPTLEPPGAAAGPTGDPGSPVAHREAPVGCPRLDTADRFTAPIYGHLLSSAGRVLRPSPWRPTDAYRTHLDERH